MCGLIGCGLDLQLCVWRDLSDTDWLVCRLVCGVWLVLV